ncbi:MAG: HIT family protein [Clostridiales bacterium]|nr:HIT family protein [Clostridiales bacterium]
MCIFCKILSGEIPSYKIYEDEHTYAFLDIADDYEGHTLVIPKEHYENSLDVPVEILKKVIATTQKVAQHYVNNCGYTGVNIMNANGVDAEQSVFHLHYHILPRKHDDGRKSWVDYPKINSDMSALCEKLRIK